MVIKTIHQPVKIIYLNFDKQFKWGYLFVLKKRVQLPIKIVTLLQVCVK